MYSVPDLDGERPYVIPLVSIPSQTPNITTRGRWKSALNNLNLETTVGYDSICVKNMIHLGWMPPGF